MNQDFSDYSYDKLVVYSLNNDRYRINGSETIFYNKVKGFIAVEFISGEDKE